jgi:transaldolase
MSIPIGIHEDVELSKTVRDLALEGFEGPGQLEFESREKYVWLKDLGSQLWLDTGDAEAASHVWSPELEALTTNNTLVNQVVRTGHFDGLIAYATRKIRQARPDISDHDLVIELAFLVNAKLALSLVQRFGAHVSVELHPDVGFDVQRTLTFARRYYDINPSYFYVKVPLTPDGYISARQLSNEGIPINFTLGFSARQNYLAARLSHPRFVNVFLGRLNSLVEENDMGEPENIGEKATLASFEAVEGVREAQTGVFTFQIAASLRSGDQVAKLAGVDVLTIPPVVADEYLALDIPRSEVRRRTSQELRVELDESRPVEASEIRRLWEIDEQFIAFTEAAVQRVDQLATGEHLMELAAEYDVNLFQYWTSEDRRQVRKKGKIPDLAEWPGVPIDDLMSISALETFAKDQEELDERIEGLIREA